MLSRRLWLASFGGLSATYALGCAPAPRAPAREPAPPPRAVPPPPRPELEPSPDASPPVAEVAPAPAPAPAGPSLRLPPRAAGAETGSAFLLRVAGLGRGATDDEVVQAISSGNVPAYLRHLVPLTIVAEDGTRARLHVACDYLAIGSDEDFIRIPMTASAAQRIADLADATLPTAHLVDLIYTQARGKLPPCYIDGGPTDESLEDYAVHHEKLEQRRKGNGECALGVLTAGHKKDIVLSDRLLERADRVAIYGWHRREGDVIQPLSTRHSRRYADYSHGVRLIAQNMEIDGEERRVTEVLADAALAHLLSNEGPHSVLAYPTALPVYTPATGKKKNKKNKGKGKGKAAKARR